MSTLRELCHCGHHKDTHHESTFNCLGMLCDCKHYRDDTKPDTKRQVAPERPAHASWCKCTRCEQWRS